MSVPPRPSTDRAAWEIWIPALLALALTVPGLGQGSLATDEALYAALAREALERWPALDLTLLGEPYGNKPPGGFWAMALSFAAFGVTTFAARLPSALAGAACCALVASLARGAFGRGAGLIAGIALAITPDWLRFTSEARLDAIALAFGLAGVRLSVAARGRARNIVLALLAGAAFGVSALVKGPIVLAPLAVGLVVLREARAIAAALAGTLVVGGWWPLAMHLSEHGAVWSELVSDELAAHTRVDGGRDLPMLARVALLRGAPASIVAIAGALWIHRRRPSEARVAALWIAVAVVCAVVPSPSYSRYAQPLFPAFAFLAGGVLATALAARPARLETTLRITRRVVVGASVVAIALPLAFGLRVHRDPAEIFAAQRAALTSEFPPDARVPVVGDLKAAETGTVVLHLRRRTERMSVEDAVSAARPTVLALGPAARAALVERGYRVETAAGSWALMRRGASQAVAR